LRDGAGQTPRGVAEKLLREGQKIFPSMTMNMVNYAGKKATMGKGEKPKLFNAMVSFDKQTVLSSLTGEISSNTDILSSSQSKISDDATTAISSSSQTKISDNATTALLMLKGVTDMTASTSNASSADTVHCPITDSVTSLQEYLDTNLNGTAIAKNIGRPKDSTVAAGISLIQQIELATKEATDWLTNNLKKQRSKKHRAEKGLLNEVIEAAKKKHCLHDNIVISTATVRSRVKRKSNSGHKGQKSPMSQVEPYLVELIKKLANMRQPLHASQGLQLANSFINNKSTQKKVLEWKSQNC
jgi:hypothetical protein